MLVSVLLALVTAGVWAVLDPIHASALAATSLVLSWPANVDGINAFADTIFHRKAVDAGVRDMTPGALSQVAHAQDIVIDKAAVLSGPDLLVTNVMAFNNDPKTLLAVAASAEACSDHPVANALRHLAADWGVALKTPDRFNATPGMGVTALLGGQAVVIGTTAFLSQMKIDSFTADAIARSLEADGKTVLRVAVGGRVVGVLGIEGTLRQDAGVAGAMLRTEGLLPWLHSGDTSKTRASLANLLGFEELADAIPGGTPMRAAARAFPFAAALVMTLSADRTQLELSVCEPDQLQHAAEGRKPIAVTDTDNIGAFSTLKALAMRRSKLSVQARNMLRGVWVLAGTCGAAGLLPLFAAPVVFAACLAILQIFARLSLRDALYKTSSDR